MPYKLNKIFFPGEVQLKKLQKGNLNKIQASTGFEPEFPEIGRVPPPTELQKICWERTNIYNSYRLYC